MGSAVVYDTYTTTTGVQGVKYAVGQALRQVGGAMHETPDGIVIEGGAQGVSMSFTAKITAVVSVRETSPNRYDVSCSLTWKPSAVVWICLIVGFFVLWFLWIISGLYFAFNPTSAYQTGLGLAHGYLPDAANAPVVGQASPVAQAAYPAPAPAAYAAATQAFYTPPAPPQAPAAAPSGGPAAVPAPLGVCPACGAERRADAAFCASCGAPVT